MKKRKQPPCGDILCEARIEILELIEQVGYLSAALQSATREANETEAFGDAHAGSASNDCDAAKYAISRIHIKARDMERLISKFQRWSKP